MPVLIRDVVQEFCNQIKNIFGEQLSRMIVYGSYARGDYHSDSDVDILLTVDISPEDICAYRRAVAQVSSDLSLKHDVTISVAVKAKQQFEKYAQELPYYQNVLREGIRYGAS